MPEYPNTDLPSDFDDEFVEKLRTVMREKGWLFPTTDEELERFEAHLEAHPINLPPELQDPYVILRPPPSSGRIHQLEPVIQSSQAAERELARAARGRQELTDEVKEKMRRDRREAEHRARSKEETS